MANLFEHKDRNVLPNWRSYTRTLHYGELTDSISDRVDPSQTKLTIADYLLSWEENKTVPIAADLLSAAFVNGFSENPTVKEAAAFINFNKDKSTHAIIRLAEGILNPTIDTPPQIIIPANIEECIERDNIYRSIGIIKKQVGKYPSNPIFYVELARLYSVIGLKQKAIQNMSVALHISAENRFILRAAARLYAHFGLHEHIHNIIKRSEIVNYDPWITSTEIALATMLKRRSLFAKKGLQMIASGKFSYSSLTELASSLGTLEFLNGNRKKTKNLLKTALIAPNDNSLAQVAWILGQGRLFEANPADYSIVNKYEALALSNYFNQKWDDALENSIAWFCDLPFSRRPAVFGAYIADSILDKVEFARKLLRVGLISHPNDAQILNNLAYSFASENRLNEAEEYLARLPNLSDVERKTRICLTATRGLILYRKGLSEQGRELYYEAIKEAKALDDRHLNLLAVLNYAREEILCNSKYVDYIMDVISDIADDPLYPDVNKLKKVVLELHAKMKMK